MANVPIRLKKYGKRRVDRPPYLALFLLFLLSCGILFMVVGGVRYFVRWGFVRFAPKESYFYPSKKEFKRFEFVEIVLKIKKGASETLLAQPELEIMDAQNQPVVSAGFIHKRRFIYDGKKKIWVARWPVPWNVKGGTYAAQTQVALQKKVKVVSGGKKEVRIPILRWLKLTYPGKDKKEKEQKPKTTYKKEMGIVRHSAHFIIPVQKLPRIAPKLRVLTIESSRDMLRGKFTGPDGEVSNASLYKWAEFLGANTLWYLAGQTASWGGKKAVTDVWQKTNVESFPELAKRAKVHKLKFGGWIACYLTFGKARFKKYQYAYDYEPRLRKCVPTDAVSLIDKNRLNDIVALAKKLQADGNVDFIGLDYIRSAAGGYEMVDEFVRDMQPEVPEGFLKWTKTERMNWLGEQVALKKFAGWEGKDFYELWNWWRAHKVASVVHAIIERAKITKPVWTFTLGWEHGFQHGQDTPMLTDAGLTVDAVMLYEINKPLFPFMMKSWRAYLKPGQSPLIAGNTVDWNLHDKTIDPPGPKEFYNRLIEGVRALNGGAKTHGAFFHDFDRLIYGRKGPFPALEWAVAGADAFSRLQELWNETPYKVTMYVRDVVALNVAYEFTVRVENTSSKPISDISVRTLKTQGMIFRGEGFEKISTLAPHSEKTVSFLFSVDKDQPRRVPMLAVETKIGDGSQFSHRLVNFAYVKVKEPPKPKEKKKDEKGKKEKKSNAKDRITKKTPSVGKKKQPAKIQIKPVQ